VLAGAAPDLSYRTSRCAPNKSPWLTNSRCRLHRTRAPLGHRPRSPAGESSSAPVPSTGSPPCARVASLSFSCGDRPRCADSKIPYSRATLSTCRALQRSGVPWQGREDRARILVFQSAPALCDMLLKWVCAGIGLSSRPCSRASLLALSAPSRSYFPSSSCRTGESQCPRNTGGLFSRKAAKPSAQSSERKQ
jgi:hypothetical protein